MMELKKRNPTRDIFLALLLIALIRPALHLSAKRQRADTPHDEAFVVHEPAADVIQAFEVAKRQLEQTITLAVQKNREDVVNKLEDMIRTLTTIKHRYTKNSPALLFLGPFASVSIVLKEMEIEQELASIVDDLNQTLYCLAEEKYQPKEEISNTKTCLEENRRLLNIFSISQPQYA